MFVWGRSHVVIAARECRKFSAAAPSNVFVASLKREFVRDIPMFSRGVHTSGRSSFVDRSCEGILLRRAIGAVQGRCNSVLSAVATSARPANNDYSSIRYFSSGKEGADPALKKIDEDKEEGRLLYKRDPGRNWRPRYLATFSTLHTVYWGWYNYDYIPALAEKGIEVSKYFGLWGLGSGFLMLALSYMYPRHLVSEIRLLQGKRMILKTYTVPFIIPEAEGTLYSRGEVRMENITDQRMILEKGTGSIADYDGHISLTKPGSRFYHLLHPHPTEVKDEAALANLLLGDALSSKDVIKLNKKMNADSDASDSVNENKPKRRRGYAQPTRRRPPSRR
jgi:hypothetical protein